VGCGSFLLKGKWACVLRAWRLVSVSVRSMTAHMAHTRAQHGTGHECGVCELVARLEDERRGHTA
jgi:hypothetical protein